MTCSNSAANMAWQRRRIEAGLCRRCGRKREQYAYYCNACMQSHRDTDRESKRRKRGTKE